MPALYSVDSSVMCFFLFQIELSDFVGTADSVILIADVRRQRRLDQILCDLSRAFAYEKHALWRDATRAFESTRLALFKSRRTYVSA